MSDPVNHPDHYKQHPSGIECIDVTEHMSFCLGNAMKYIWRSDWKDEPKQDLKKAIFYIQRELARRWPEEKKEHIDMDALELASILMLHLSKIEAFVNQLRRMEIWQDRDNSGFWSKIKGIEDHTELMYQSINDRLLGE